MHIQMHTKYPFRPYPKLDSLVQDILVKTSIPFSTSWITLKQRTYHLFYMQMILKKLSVIINGYTSSKSWSIWTMGKTFNPVCNVFQTTPVGCVHNNGWRSDFKVSIKVVPYAHISSYCVLKFYLMQLEEMKTLRALKDSKIKIIQYTDDTTLLYANAKPCMHQSSHLQTSRWFQASQLRVKKTEVIWISGISNTNIILDTETNLQWTDEPYKGPWPNVRYFSHKGYVDIEL